jgi:hypothetical protein
MRLNQPGGPPSGQNPNSGKLKAPAHEGDKANTHTSPISFIFIVSPHAKQKL